jgi:hypothetical protein
MVFRETDRRVGAASREYALLSEGERSYLTPLDFYEMWLEERGLEPFPDGPVTHVPRRPVPTTAAEWADHHREEDAAEDRP